MLDAQEWGKGWRTWNRGGARPAPVQRVVADEAGSHARHKMLSEDTTSDKMCERFRKRNVGVEMVEEGQADGAKWVRPQRLTRTSTLMRSDPFNDPSVACAPKIYLLQHLEAYNCLTFMQPRTTGAQSPHQCEIYWNTYETSGRPSSARSRSSCILPSSAFGK